MAPRECDRRALLRGHVTRRHTGLFDDDLDGLADRMDEAHVYSMCTEAKDDAKSKKTNVTQFHSATTELG